MAKTFINYSNHPSDKWSDQMLAEARAYGEIIDIPFMPVGPALSTEQVHALAEEIVSSIIADYPDKDETVIMLQGEMTLSFRMVSLLQEKGYRCVASTSERICTIDEEGNRVTRFEFCRFRQY